MAKRYYWLKFKDDFFTNKKIKKLRRIAGGDTYTIIYLKMMLKCMNNDGVLEYEGIEESFAEELALDIDEDSDNVQITINFLMQAGMLEDMGEHHYFMPEVPELTGSESTSAQRVRKLRERQKALQCNSDVTVMLQHSNTDVTMCNTEKEREKEKRKEKIENINYQKIIDMFNETCVSLARVTRITDKRKKMIKTRLKTYSEDDIYKAFGMIEKSDFLRGKNGGWKCSFDWLFKNDENIAKVLEGNYKNNNKIGGIERNEQYRDSIKDLFEFETV